jgi:hypothetical protein
MIRHNSSNCNSSSAGIVRSRLEVVVPATIVTIPSQLQQAEAAQPSGRGCEFTPGGNASKTRCVR